MDIHEALEVLDRFDLEFKGRVLVADQNGARMLLEGGDRPHVVHPLLYRLIQRKCFVSTSDNDHDLWRMRKYNWDQLFQSINDFNVCWESFT